MPGHLPALEARLRLHDMVGEHEQAEAIAERIVSIEPGRVSGETRLVEGLLQRDPPAAVARVQALVEQAPEAHRADLRTWMGEIQDRAGQPQEALRTWLSLQADQARNACRCHRRPSLRQAGRRRVRLTATPVPRRSSSGARGLGRGARGDRPGVRQPGAAQRPLHQQPAR